MSTFEILMCVVLVIDASVTLAVLISLTLLHKFFRDKANELLEDKILVDEIESMEYVDLGLPSGTLWATRNIGDGVSSGPKVAGFYNAQEGINIFGDKLPTSDQFRELMTECFIERSRLAGGIKLTGKNGNSIYLPAAGYFEERENLCEGEYGAYLIQPEDTKFCWEYCFNGEVAGFDIDDPNRFFFSVRLVASK